MSTVRVIGIIFTSFLIALPGCDLLGGILPPPAPGAPKIEAQRTGCSEVSLSTSLRAISDDPNATFQWYFTDGTVRLGREVVHTFDSAGEYMVTLVTSDHSVQRRISVPVRGDSDGGPDPFGDRCVPNEGERHVPNGSTVTYMNNPPASGSHYAVPGVAPAAPGLYPDPLRPEIWVHNLEHGYVTVLYDCDGDCPQSLLDELQILFDLTPPSNFGNKKMIITRYPGLPVPVMAVAWDVQRDFNFVDVDGILAFYNRRVDRGPENAP